VCSWHRLLFLSFSFTIVATLLEDSDYACEKNEGGWTDVGKDFSKHQKEQRFRYQVIFLVGSGVLHLDLS
jgi:hypothetical protein